MTAAVTRTLTVELFGVARSRAGVGTVAVDVPAAATLGDALAALAAALPALVGPVLAPDGRALQPGSAASEDGGPLLRDPASSLSPGRPLLLLPASAGG